MTGSLAAADAAIHAFTQILDPPLTGGAGPLAGLRVAVKDNIDVEGVVTGLGRPLDEHEPARRDAAAVARLRAAGAVIVGKTNLPEFASSAVTTNTHYGDTRNPADLTRTAGGSSGGSAAAVAAGMVPVALGTDTAGSVVMPAALTGCWGYRPTHGLIDTAGVAPMSPTLDTVGVFAADPTDLLRVAAVLTRHPPAPPPAELRVGLLGDPFTDADPAVLDAVRAALEDAPAIPVTTIPVTLPSARTAAAHGRAIYLDEVHRSFAAQLDPARTYAPSVEARRAAGDPAAAASARLFRARWQAEIATALDLVDVLAAPATPVVAPPFPVADEAALVRFTYPFCLAGQPAVAVPCGTAGGLPVGLLLVGRRGADAALLAAAAHLDPAGGTAR
ncbi:amidase family protein [Pseudonocardia thermophila]|uniref:amidase family protein n=1 Tax=Pseudonocardia thermophila TaxID=1848 RepID=UPI00248E7399|nr:amidase [Pseudonocardia thermophila]